MSDLIMYKVTFIGDVMPGRLLTVSGHEAQMKELSSVSDERDKSFDFSNAEVGASLANCLADSDFRLANLEGFIYESSSCSSYTAGRILADPLKFISSHGIGSHNLKILSDLNINCFSVANNHILDGKIEGVRETIGILKRHKLKWVGFGKDFESAWKPRIVKVRDSNIVPNKPMKIAIFALSDHYTEWRADDRQPGINFFNVEMFSFEEENPNWERWTNFSHVTNEIRKVRLKVDIVIFSLHWGENYKWHPSEKFQEFAHALIDHGVDIIFGHSAHHIQGIEVYKEKLIIYNAGDFLNDYDMFEKVLNRFEESFGPEPRIYNSHLSFIYTVSFVDTNDSWKPRNLTLFPIRIQNGKVDRATASDEKWLYAKVQELSRSFNTVFDYSNKDDLLHIPIAKTEEELVKTDNAKVTHELQVSGE